MKHLIGGFLQSAGISFGFKLAKFFSEFYAIIA